MPFTKEEYHNMVDRQEAIAHKFIDMICDKEEDGITYSNSWPTKDEAEEFLRLQLLLKPYFRFWKLLFTNYRYIVWLRKIRGDAKRMVNDRM